ncbi:transposase [Patescibacteria group bacterium]|nr:transposase [Patescibacteria group bacterium]
MPAKNIVKTYKPNSYYHLYNRGVDKRTIYQDKQDYAVFLSYLKEYLSPIPSKNPKRKISVNEKTYQIKGYQCCNYHQNIILLIYCLMPNHFHLLVKQELARDIEYFMKSLATRYTTYFNKRNQRSGTLFEGTYKAVLVKSEEQFIHLSRYIHLNPHPKPLTSQPSSYPDYMKLKNTSWVHTQTIIDHFKNPMAYKKFIEDGKKDQLLPTIKSLILDS